MSFENICIGASSLLCNTTGIHNTCIGTVSPPMMTLGADLHINGDVYFKFSSESAEVAETIGSSDDVKRSLTKVIVALCKRINNLESKISELSEAVYYAPSSGAGFHLAKQSFSDHEEEFQKKFAK